MTPEPAATPAALMSVAEKISALGVVATFLAVVVALLKDEIVRLWRRPVLVAKIHLGPPDCHRTVITRRYAVSTTPTMAHCFYFRLWVENKGNQRAERVQVFVAKLFRWHADGSFKEDHNFLPMNLRWAHSQGSILGPEIFADGISPGMGKHCDLGHIVDPQMNMAFDTDLPQSVGKATLALDLEVEPFTKTHLLAPDKYRLVLKLAAANARPVTTTLEVNHTGNWFMDEAKMFKEGIGIKMVDA